MPRAKGHAWLGDRNQNGQATFETAAMLPVALFVVLSVVQVGLLWRDQLLVVHSAREAARATAVDGGGGVAQRAAREALDIDPARITATVVRRESVGGLVTVEVSLSPLTSLPLFGALLSGRSVSARATMLVEASGTSPELQFGHEAEPALRAEQSQYVKRAVFVEGRVATTTVRRHHAGRTAVRTAALTDKIGSGCDDAGRGPKGQLRNPPAT